MLVDDTTETREVEPLAGPHHRRGQRGGLLRVHPAPHHGHAERRHLVIGNVALRVPLDESVDLVSGQLAAVALSLDELNDPHAVYGFPIVFSSSRSCLSTHATMRTSACGFSIVMGSAAS